MPRKIRAIGYCRRSTKDMQENSLEIQEELIRKYAQEHDYELIRIFADKASGRQIAGRDSFLELLEAVDREDFEKILVRDVTRWGRFDDIDESAYWEYYCKLRGKKVVYIEEDFKNDNSLYDALIKNIKRVMAAEFSRKLGMDVLTGCKKIASQGFKVGGNPPYAMRRMLVNSERKQLRILEKGERKTVGNDRVILIPGDKEQIGRVNDLFCYYVNEGLSGERIANWFNSQDIPSPGGKKWRGNTVLTILKRETYIGTMVYNMTSRVPGSKKRRRNPETEWVRCLGAFIPIVAKEIFFKARDIRLSRLKRYSDIHLLTALNKVYETYGKATGRILAQDRSAPSADIYRKRFGSLEMALALSQEKDIEAAKENVLGHLRKSCQVKEMDGYYLIDNKLRLIIQASILQAKGKSLYWVFHINRSQKGDFILGLGLSNGHNNKVTKYFLFPSILFGQEAIKIPFEEEGLHKIYEWKEEAWELF